MIAVGVEGLPEGLGLRVCGRRRNRWCFPCCHLSFLLFVIAVAVALGIAAVIIIVVVLLPSLLLFLLLLPSLLGGSCAVCTDSARLPRLLIRS